MNTLETIKKDLIAALKDKDKVRVSTLRLIEAVLKNKEIAKRGQGKPTEFSDDEIVQILSFEAKKRKEAIEAFQKGGRADLAEKESKELEIIKKYLPAQLSGEEIEKEVKSAIAELKPSGPSDFGKLMGFLSKKLKGRADGKTISEILKKELGV